MGLVEISTPSITLLGCRKLYCQGHRFHLIHPDDLADDDMVAELGIMGAPLVGEARLLAQLPQHLLVEVDAHACHARLDLRPGADRGEVEEAGLDHVSSPGFRRPAAFSRG